MTAMMLKMPKQVCKAGLDIINVVTETMRFDWFSETGLRGLLLSQACPDKW